jgi:class 3 adenylate cyclase
MERRLTAILAADVVGYSRLMEVDEVGTLERLKALRESCSTP